MYEDLIEKVMKRESTFLGAFANDELPKIKKYPSCCIVNNEPRSKAGGHWVAVYFDKNKSATFFDSYAYPPSYSRMQKRIQENSDTWSFNKKRIQGDSDLCGLYAIFFCLFSAKNKQREFFSKFGSNFSKNDNLLKQEFL